MLSREVYEQLHRNPELSYQEYQTTKLIKSILSNYDLEIIELDPTGLIAKTQTNFKQSLVFRADIDALPITEKTGISYQSQNIGVMHSCGHDLHTAGLLEFISKIDFTTINHNLIFIFQPGEEVDGGARICLKHKLFDNLDIDGIYAIHIWPQLDYGLIGCKPGVMMATNYVFNLSLSGVSTHCSTPNLGSEMISLIASFTNYLNTIISKLTSIDDGLAINIGKIVGGEQANITLSELSLFGTIRALNDNILEQVVLMIEDFLNSNTRLYKLDYKFQQVECTYPCVENSRKLIDFHQAKQTIESPSYAVEDFGFYKHLGPTLFAFIGCKEENQMSLHNQSFLPNPELITEVSNYYLRILGDWNNA